MLVENEDGHFTCPQPYHKDRLYHITMVVLYTKDFKQYASEIEQNALDEAKLSKAREDERNDFIQ